jgi:hypothetical protein
MIKIYFLFFSLFITLNSYAQNYISFGGYTSFPFSTQDDVGGGTALLSFDPILSYGITNDFMWGHKLITEVGFSTRLSTDDGYSKSTLYLLADLALPISSGFLLRYGFGYFRTSVGGDGAQILIANGSGTAYAYRPGTSTTSANATINLGLETVVQPRTSLRLETYFFEFLSSKKIDLSYTLSVNYFL